MTQRRLFALWFVVIAIIAMGYFAFTGSFGHRKLPVDGITNGNLDQLFGPESDPATVLIKDITAGMIGRRVTAIGSIMNITNHKDGHMFLLVADGEGVIEIPIFADKKIDHAQFKDGKSFSFTGKVNEYRGKLEIVPETQNDITAVDIDIDTNDNGLVTKERVGQVVTVEGHLVAKYNHPDGHVFLTLKLTETDSEITVPVFSTMKYDATDFAVNSLLSIEGRVEIYNDALQVIPKDEGGITVLDEGSEAQVALVDISGIRKEHRGQTIMVRGYVSDLSRHKEHLYFKLSMGGSGIAAVLFKANSNENAGREARIESAAKEYFPIRVLGTVDVYNDRLEIIIEKVYREY